MRSVRFRHETRDLGLDRGMSTLRHRLRRRGELTQRRRHDRSDERRRSRVVRKQRFFRDLRDAFRELADLQIGEGLRRSLQT